MIRPCSLATLIVALATSAFAQQTAHIGYIYPAGGRQGSTFQVVVGGQRLAQPAAASITRDGIEATVLEYNRPMTQKEFNDLRDDLRSLQEKHRAASRRSQSSTNTWTAADEKKFADLRAKLLKNPPNRDGNPAIAEKVILQIKIATNAPLGDCELRILGATGLSNPMKFCVDALPESTAPAGSAPNPEIDRFKRLPGIETNSTASVSERRINLPVIVNGQIMPGQTDRFRFKARKGEQLIAQARARDLVPYLADAVPGWFQTTLGLYDSKGKEVAYNDDFRFNPDSVLHCEIPRDGEYVLEIKDSIFRGREDFVYRLSVGELPFITDVFPMGGRVGENVSVHLRGWNLATDTLRLTLPAYPTNLLICTTNESRVSNPVLFAVDNLPERTEKDLNASQQEHQKLTLPLVVNGVVSKPGEEDIFEFTGQVGELISLEVLARRLGSPLDSFLRLTDSAGQVLASNDDFENKAEGLETHHADSLLQVALPKDGTYQVRLADSEGRGGEDFAYRLRVSKPRSDFAMRLSPSSLVSRGGLGVPVTVHIFRSPGFTNLVELKDENGLPISGGIVYPGQDKLRLSLSPPATKGIAHLKLFAHAQTEAGAVKREVVPADDMMQAFFYHHLVAAQELTVATLNSQWKAGARIKVLSSLPVRLPLGGSARVELSVPPALFNDRFRFELSEPPPGITLSRAASERGSIELRLGCDPKKAKPGLKENLIFNIVTGRSGDGKKDNKGNQRFVIGCLPAIPIEVVPQQVTENKP